MAKRRCSIFSPRSRNPDHGSCCYRHQPSALRRAVFFSARLPSMKRANRLAFGICWLLAASLCPGAERVEIVLDTSMGMWDTFPTGTPRIVAARSAINAFVVSPAVREFELEIGLRTVGGRSEIFEGSGCGDSETVVATGPVDPPQWSSALADLDPRGGRALVHAVEEAAEHLAGGDGEGRIVMITSGPDQCYRDINVLLDTLSQEENPIPVRIIGLNIDHALASSLIQSTPTRNVSDPAKLLDTLGWAMLPPGVDSTRPEWLELQLTRRRGTGGRSHPAHGGGPTQRRGDLHRP